MFCLYSKSCEYAIRALVEASERNDQTNFKAADICLQAGIPESYARKTFQALVQSGFLQAVSGPGGGYSLKRDPKEITVMDVIEAVEGPDSFSGCILGFSACGDKAPCPLHAVWTKLKGQIIEALCSRTLFDLSQSLQKKRKSSRDRTKKRGRNG